MTIITAHGLDTSGPPPLFLFLGVTQKVSDSLEWQSLVC